MVTTQRTTGTITTRESRYCLSSLPDDPVRLNQIVPTHWRIENELHWVRDVDFDGDQSRVRRGYADQNIALAQRIALRPLKQDASTKGGMKAKRSRAACDNALSSRC